jgi:hypothetical protein
LCFLIPRKSLRLAGQEHGRAIPLSDICTAANCSLFDHLVGEDVELRRNGQAELVGSRAVEAARWHWRSLCDGHHRKALFIAELRKKNRAFLTAPALAGISSDLMQSQEATDHCRRRPIGPCTHAQIRDDGPNMETYHEGTYRSSRVGHADCGPDIRSPGERGSDVPGELLIRL